MHFQCILLPNREYFRKYTLLFFPKHQCYLHQSYGRNHSNNFFGDDRIIAKINSYTVRIVTNEKDFELEERVEDLFDELGIGYNVVTDEDIKIEKVHCTEWEIELLDGCK